MLPRSLPVLHAFFAVRYFVPHSTQKAKPAFPPPLARTCCQGTDALFYHSVIASDSVAIPDLQSRSVQQGIASYLAMTRFFS